MKEKLHNNWKRCNWWFQDKCNDYQHCEDCKLHRTKKEIVEMFRTIREYKIELEVFKND